MTDPVRVVGWQCESCKYTYYDKRDHLLSTSPCRQNPLILAHDEAGWLEELANRLEETNDWSLEPHGEYVTDLRAHAKELKELK